MPKKKTVIAVAPVPKPELDSAFQQNEDGTFQLTPLPGADYRDGYEDEEDQEPDEEYSADEVDLALASAAPDDLPDESAVEPAIIAPQRAAKFPLVRPFDLGVLRFNEDKALDPLWPGLFAHLAPRVFAEFDVDAALGANLVLYPDDAREDDREDDPDEEREKRDHVTRVQTAILEIFAWAISREVQDREKILKAIRDNLSEEKSYSLNEWMHHSNGPSAIWRVYFDYEGSWDDGASLNDGFSIQSAARATRNDHR